MLQASTDKAKSSTPKHTVYSHYHRTSDTNKDTDTQTHFHSHTPLTHSLQKHTDAFLVFGARHLGQLAIAVFELFDDFDGG